MRNMICLSIVLVSMCGCNAIPTTSTSTTEACRIAGSSQSEINNLRTLIENARDAGALADDVLSDASTSCEVCLDPNVDCDATLCESCFSAIVSEVFAEQK